jgi:hypothetical protein
MSTLADEKKLKKLLKEERELIEQKRIEKGNEFWQPLEGSGIMPDEVWEEVKKND